VLDFFAGSGTTGHAVMKLNAEDNGKRKFILCNNNENNICREVTYERIKKVIKIDNYKVSLKYMKVNFIPITDKFYYEYADQLLMYVKELVEIENFINFDGNKEIAIILTEKELDKFTNNIPIECKKVYLGHNILPTEEQEMLFKRNKIKINIIPDYYYRDLEE
jgi:adenine-specific DNA-methyltransferase